MAYKPISITGRNLFSYENIDYEFPETPQATQIVGVNKCDKGLFRNGSGKSSILEIFAICFKGAPIRAKGTLKDCIRRGCDSALAQLHLRCPDSGDLEISWTIYPKKASELEILINGEPQEFASVNEGKELIQSLIGRDSSQLDSYYVIGKNKFKPLMEMSDVAVKKTLSSFSNTENVDDAIDSIDLDIEESNTKIGSLDLEESKIQGRLETLTETLEEKKENPPSVPQTSVLEPLDNSEKIKECKKAIKSYEKEIEADKAKIKKHEQNLVIYSKNLSYAESDIEKLDAKHEEYVGKLRQLTRYKKGKVECPECEHEFNPESDKNWAMHKVELSIPKVEAAIAKVEGRLEEAKKTLSKWGATVDTTEDDIRSLKRSIGNKKGSIEAEDGIMHSYKEAEERTLKMIEEAKNVQPTDHMAPWRAEIVELSDKIEKSEEESKAITEKKRGIQGQIDVSNASKKVALRFRAHLLHSCLLVIEKIVNETLDNMESDLQVQLEGFKTLKSGEIKEAISALIIRDEVDIIPYGSMSGGERARVDLAFLIAIQDMWNVSEVSGNGLDILVLDEIMESVENEGIDLIMKSLNKVGKPILMITQNQGNKNHTNTIHVEKGEDGISRIITHEEN